jgi:hypothetical protein
MGHGSRLHLFGAYATELEGPFTVISSGRTVGTFSETLSADGGNHFYRVTGE